MASDNGVENKQDSVPASDKVHYDNRSLAFEYHLRRLVRDGGMVDLNAPMPDSPAPDLIGACILSNPSPRTNHTPIAPPSAIDRHCSE